MDYSCPNCKENLKFRFIKYKYHKAGKGIFGFYHQCPNCLSLIERNQHQFELNISVFVCVPLMFLSILGTQYLHDNGLEKNEAQIISFTLAIIFGFPTIKYFMNKIPKDWPYWKLFLVARTP